MRTLKRPYLQIENENELTYGGNQAWFEYRFLRKAGCGVVGAADVLLYLRGRQKLGAQEYREFLKQLWSKYFPVIPGFGMNGLTLMVGLNRYFIKNHLSYRACWKISGKKMLTRIDAMLAKDIPVILAVGPNFPKLWGKNKLNFYVRTDDGRYVPAIRTKAHFVTVTGRDGVWLEISSWGKRYYIDFREYKEYVRQCSSPLVSNILEIKKGNCQKRQDVL